MTPLLLLVAGAIVGIGAAVATGARDARIASLGLLGLLVAAPFVADPLPAPLPLAFGVAAGILAGFLVFVSARRIPDGPAPTLGFPATLVTAAAGYVAGLGATAVALPRLGPDAALAAGLAALAVAVGPIAVSRDIVRLGPALIVLFAAGSLVLTALAGTPPALTGIATGLLFVVLAAGAAVVGSGAVTLGATTGPDEAHDRRPAVSRPRGDAR